MSEPRLLDLCCCQGGASAGYTDAGWRVDAVDLDPQPRHYPGARFIQADAFTYLGDCWRDYDAVHVSPVCQGYSDCQRIQGRDHPMQIGLFRKLLHSTRLPYVIENVEAARWAMRSPVLLCGAAFGLHTYRHRLFESNVPLDVPPHAPHLEVQTKMGRPLREGDWYHAVGNFSNVPYVRADLGVPWMNRDGIRECIPPVYAEHVGRQLLAHITARSWRPTCSA